MVQAVHSGAWKTALQPAAVSSGTLIKMSIFTPAHRKVFIVLLQAKNWFQKKVTLRARKTPELRGKQCITALFSTALLNF